MLEKNKKYGRNLKKKITFEKNYKKDIKDLTNKINDSGIQLEHYFYLKELDNSLVKLIDNLHDNIIDNFPFKEKLYYYLTYLFNKDDKNIGISIKK